jgi:hypothetical protein
LCVSAAVVLSLKHNLMQIRWTFISVFLAGRYGRKTALRRRQYMYWKNTQVHTAQTAWLVHDTWRPTTVIQEVFLWHSNFRDFWVAFRVV